MKAGLPEDRVAILDAALTRWVKAAGEVRGLARDFRPGAGASEAEIEVYAHLAAAEAAAITVRESVRTAYSKAGGGKG